MWYQRLLARRRRPRPGEALRGAPADDDHVRLATDGGQPDDDGPEGGDAGEDAADRDETDGDPEEPTADADETDGDPEEPAAEAGEASGDEGVPAAEADDGPGTTADSPVEPGDLEEVDDEAEDSDGETGGEAPGAGGGGVDRPNVDITEAGEAEPADPKWERPDLEDIPEFEVTADEPVVSGGTGIGDEQAEPDASDATDDADGPPDDPTAGMPNTARAPGATRISAEGTDAYIVAMELCARLPDDVRLPEEAAELVPTAVEAELEQDIQQFAAAEFGTQTPHVDTLAFEDVEGEIWLRLRIGLPAEGFADIDPEEIRAYALEQLEGVL